MKIIDARVVVASPGRNYVTLVSRGRGRGDRARRRDPQWPRARRRLLPAGSRLPIARRPRCAPDRGHLAVPLPGRLLAARAGDDDRHRGGRRRAVGHQGQDRRASRVRAARGCGPRRGHGLLPRQRVHPGRARARTSSAISTRATSRSERRQPSRAWRRPTASRRPMARSTSRPAATCPQQDIWETSYYLDFAPQVMAHLRREFGYARPPAARCPPPADAD